jgi:hypothetical protein
MKGLRLTAGLGVLLLLVCMGCSSDGDGITGDPVESQITEPELESLMADAVLPALELLDFSFLAQGTSLESSRGNACEDQSETFCPDGGTAEICIDLFNFFINLDQCNSDGEISHGSITGTPTSDTAFDIELDVLIGDLDLSGSLSLTRVDGCLREKLNGLSASSPDGSASYDGELLYCIDAYPIGDLDVYMVLAGVFDYHFALSMDGTGTALVSVFDISSGDPLLSCSIDLESSEANCTTR